MNSSAMWYWFVFVSLSLVFWAIAIFGARVIEQHRKKCKGITRSDFNEAFRRQVLRAWERQARTFSYVETGTMHHSFVRNPGGQFTKKPKPCFYCGTIEEPMKGRCQGCNARKRE